VNFEDELRETMRAHDHEAPTVADLPDRPWLRRRRPWLSLAAAAAVIAVAVGVLVAVEWGKNSSHRVAALTTADCPGRYPATGVPAPAHGVDGTGRLVPNSTPTNVIICAYLEHRGALTAGRSLRGDLSAVTDTLTWLPRGDASEFLCPLAPPVSGFDDNFLIGLSYPDGAIWVAAPGSTCDGASNGEFTTAANLHGLADPAWSTRTWDPNAGAPKGSNPCQSSGFGRLGQDTELVPGTPTGVRICHGAIDHGSSYDPAPLARALDQLPSTPSTHSCISTGPGASGVIPQPYTLDFSYPTGPDVRVDILPICRPSVDNDSLASGDSSTIMALLRDLGVAP
jgi:hypothetical protein